MMGSQLTDVVKHLIIINVIVFLGASNIPGFPNLALYPPVTDGFSPYQIVTHMFMHANFNHLLFNMLALFFLAPNVERILGPQKFLILYITCGMGSMLAHLAVGYTTGDWAAVVGASGAVYGVLVAFAMYFPNLKLQLMFIPIDIKAKYLAIGLIAYDLYSGAMGRSTGVAHFAHIGGAITGLLMVLFWRKNP